MDIESVLVAGWIVIGAAGFAAGMIGLAATKRRLRHAELVDVLATEQDRVAVG